MLGTPRSFLASLFLVILGLSARAGEPSLTADPAALADFENKVRPLLAARCVKCHGPRKQESNLRLDSRVAMMQGGDTGPAIVPGKADESLLVKAIRHEGEIQMPPDAQLDREQISTLTRWVARGAPWPNEVAGAMIRQGGITPEDRAFWSLQPVRHLAPPHVHDRNWVRSPVDSWILSGLESKGLRPASSADRRTLIRRANFDLTGLPPTPAEVEAFLSDSSPDAFAKVVDRLLASPAYGERWGRLWLDVVRYADTAGETADYPVVEAYKYRDYVISAFNQDMPYDQFIREQVAGDILAGEESADSYARLVTATGFLAVSRRFGFDSENYHYLTIQDTIDTLGQAVLGLTLGCARCHDHKYDPVSTRDYYALYGIFDSTRYAFPGSEQKPTMRSMASLHPPAEAETHRDAYTREFAALEANLKAKKALPRRITIATLDELDGDFELQKPSAGGSLGCLVPPWLVEGAPEVIAQAQSPFKNVSPIEGTVGIRFPNDASDHRVWQRVFPARTSKSGGKLYFNIDFRKATEQAVGPGTYRFSLGHGAGRSPAVEIFVGERGILVRNGKATESIRPLRPLTWYNLRLVLDMDRKMYSGVIGFPGDEVSFTDKSFSVGWDGTIDTILMDGRGPVAGTRPALDVDNVAFRETPIPPVRVVAELTSSSPKAQDDPGRRLSALIERRAGELAYGVAEGTPHDARIQKRGEPLKLGDVVPRRFLEILGGDSLTDGAEGSGRLQLADWLTRPSNPLTARVMVNRIWQGHFGNGLVATENDFGRRGRRPTHPELLDDLAQKFMLGGWSIKTMHRLIMLSSTYQLASDYDPPSAEIDPSNERLWRFPPRRLDAESIRDAILLLGGGLDRSPAQPHPFPPIGTAFTQHGPFYAVYPSARRSVYLMTQRNRRHPYLSLFDGPDTNASTAKRSITTVPTQALFFMNDPFVHEQAEGFARRILATQDAANDRIRLGYRMAFAREPLEQEIEKTKTFLDRYRRQLAVDGLSTGDQERLSWSAFARTLFTRNEFVFIE